MLSTTTVAKTTNDYSYLKESSAFAVIHDLLKNLEDIGDLPDMKKMKKPLLIGLQPYARYVPTHEIDNMLNKAKTVEEFSHALEESILLTVNSIIARVQKEITDLRHAKFDAFIRQEARNNIVNGQDLNYEAGQYGQAYIRPLIDRICMVTGSDPKNSATRHTLGSDLCTNARIELYPDHLLNVFAETLVSAHDRSGESIHTLVETKNNGLTQAIA